MTCHDAGMLGIIDTEECWRCPLHGRPKPLPATVFDPWVGEDDCVLICAVCAVERRNNKNRPKADADA